MKSRGLIFNYIILLVFCLVLSGGLGAGVAFADVDNFYFSDFTGDYYLSKDTEGVSRLKVKESVTAEFPEYAQNKGICRQIPYTNQGGKNITLPNLTRDDIKLTRNGEAEPIYSISKEAGYYNVCTGTEDYVFGAQTYVFEYEFSKVVTEFNEGEKVFQELYWDTNGNGARQKFDSVTARLHFDDIGVFAGESWCYVGTYGANGQERCTTAKIDDGIEFTALNLASYENLTFDVELKAGSFTVPEPEKNYFYVLVIAVMAVAAVGIIGFYLRKYLKSREKEKYYKSLFVAPEYQPHPEYGLAEMTEIYLGKKKDVKVALLLEMIVERQVELKKGEKKKWSLIVKTAVGGEYNDLLRILNGGSTPKVGDEIEIKQRTATSSLVSIKNSMEKQILNALKQDGLVEDKYNIGSSAKRGFGNVLVMTFIVAPIIIMLGLFVLGVLENLAGIDNMYGGDFVFYENFFKTAFIIIVATVAICVALTDRAQKYAGHTLKGLEMVRYMEGLEMYIRMAEADRIKMLQSIEGADTSSAGIVKLYEKLLPYAAVFGLEESWMKEMKEYCEVQEVAEPDYLLTGIAVSELSRGLRNAASVATNSTIMSSSGGGSSSGFSGGGGGGFSGGGGGGGGFSGR